MAQTPLFERFQLTHYTDQNGLPQNSVKRMTVDASGYLWMATENGLTRFDGRFFQTYNKADFGLRSSRIFALKPSVIQADGPQGRNLCFYAEDETGHFTRVQDGKPHLDSTYDAVRQKALPFYTRAQTGMIEAFGLPRYDTGVKFDHYVICRRKNGEAYLCTPDSISFYQFGQPQWRIRFPAANIWNFFTLDGRLCYLDNNSIQTIDESGKISRLPINGDLTGDLSNNKITEFNLFWNYASEQLFVGLADKVYQMTFENGTVRTHLLLKGFDMRSHYIQTVHYEAKEGILWMGSITQGLYMFKKQAFRPVSWGRSEMEDVFYGQTVSPGGRLTTANGMQVRRNTDTGGVEIGTAPGIKAVYQWDARSILTDHQGNIWLKHTPWLYQFDSLGRRQLNKIKLPADYAKVIYQSPEGLIWVGTEHQGLFYVDPSQGRPELHPFMPTGFDDINCIVSAGTQKLWVGTKSGMFLVDTRSRSKKAVEGTRKWNIKSIFVDQGNNVWFTILDIGIALLKDGKVTPFPLDRKGYLASAHCMAADRQGRFWVPTNRGLFQIQKQDLLAYHDKDGRNASLLPDFYHYFDQSSGFLINEFNGSCQPCGVRLSDGTLSLPSLKGLVWFMPEKVIATPQHPVITVDAVEYNGNRFWFDADTLRLSKDPQQLRILLSTPYFGHTDNLHLAYRLEKDENSTREDGSWYRLDNNFPAIQYTSLNSGIYTLTIRKSNGLEKDRWTTKQITIIVPPHWYETWWAKAVAISGLLLISYLFSQWRLTRVQMEKAGLEQAVSSRTAELKAANQQLEASKNEVSKQLILLSRLLTSMSHDIRSPLHYIEMVSGRIPALLDNGNGAFIREISQSIHKSSRDMSALLKDLLDYLRVNLYGQSLHLQIVNLSSLVSNKQQLFKDVIKEKANSVQIDVDENLEVFTDYQLLSIIVHNLVDNACKYTRNGGITITGRKDAQGVKLTFSNTGIPLSASLIESFNSVEDESEASSHQTQKGSGLGLVIVKEIARLLGISVSAVQTEVSSFTIAFPSSLENGTDLH